MIPIAVVLTLLGFKPLTTRCSTQRGPCPLHGSTSGTSRCFSVDLDGNRFHCFKCNRGGNAIDLWAQANRLTPYDAALDLCNRLGIEVPLLVRGNREEEPVTIPDKTCTMPTP